MKRSIIFRSFAATTLMFVVCFLVFGLMMILTGRSFIVQEKKDELQVQANQVRRYAEAVRWKGGLYNWDLRMNLTTIAISSGDHIFLCNGEGKVVTSSDEEFLSPYIGTQIEETVLTTVREEGSYDEVTDLCGFYGEQRYVVGVPISGGDDRVDGYVFVSYESGEFFDAWGGYIPIFVVVALSVLAVAIVLDYLYARRLGRPLRDMAEAARKLAGGDYAVRVLPSTGDNEITALTQAFNVMAEGLEKNETRRSEFIANISHELRTPLTTIAGFADAIMDDAVPAAEEKKYIATISSEAKRLGRLVRSMLDLSRLREGDPERREGRFDLSETVVQTVLGFEKRVDEKRLSMDLNMPEDPIFAKGDVDAITRVVYNLTDNAIKFARAGSELAVSLWKENNKVWVSVKDEGETIPEEELPLIFDRFHKSDRSRSLDKDGVGLGLYLVKSIINSHDEDIAVKSEDGATEFVFTLKLADK